MPRRKGSQSGLSSAFRQVQKQAQSLLSKLRREIVGHQGALQRLQSEEQRLRHLIGARITAVTSGRGAPRRRTRGGRVNWRVVLKQVPKQFKAADVRKVRGLKGKRPSEIFAAITRWIDAGMVKRKARGVYERI